MDINIFIRNLVSYLIRVLDNVIHQNDYKLSICERWSIWRQIRNLPEFVCDELKDENDVLPWRLIKLNKKLDDAYVLLDNSNI